MNRRLPAEWEKQSAVQLTFPHEDTHWAPRLNEVLTCFIAIAEAIAVRQKLIVVCKDAVFTKKMLAHLPQENVIITEIPSNDTWARDHGGITIFEEESPAIIDFIFNGWGLKFASDKDNLITHELFNKNILNANMLYKTGMVLEGGGIESDGEGIIMTTSPCQLSPNRNPHFCQDDIEESFRELFGTQKVLWLENGYLAGDDTDSHIDTLARFCDKNTIAYVKCTDPEDEHFEALSAMEQELMAFTNLKGEKYQLAALPMPKAIFDEDGQRLPATYANFLIINGAVLVPIYGVPQDKQALETLQTCFPKHEIIPIDCRVLIYEHGSLHCVTMQYPDGVVV